MSIRGRHYNSELRELTPTMAVVSLEYTNAQLVYSWLTTDVRWPKVCLW